MNWFTGWKFTGHFTTIDLIAASTNALNGALLSRRPDHYKNFTIVGVLCMALLMGLGGGITRDVLVGQGTGRTHRPGLHHARARLRLPRLQARLREGAAFPRGPLPVHDLLLASLVRDRRRTKRDRSRTSGSRHSRAGGRRAYRGRWYADVTSGVPPKHFVRGEWFVGIAALTGLTWVVFYWLIVQQAGASIWWPTLIAFAVGYALRLTALYRGWEEPLAAEPAGVHRHDDGRPHLGRKLSGKSQRELRDLGLLVETEETEAVTG